MKLLYGGAEPIDLDTIHGPSDLMDFINSIQPHDKYIGPDRKEKPSDNEILFDTCTPKEIALRNLADTLASEEKLRKKRLLNKDACELYHLKQRTTVGEIILPPVSYEDYIIVQKIAYIRVFVENYVAMLIQARVGFGLHARIDSKGDIYVLKDLRDLYQFG